MFSSGFTRQDYQHLLANGITLKGKRVGPASLFVEIQQGQPDKASFFLIGRGLQHIINTLVVDRSFYCIPGSQSLLSNPDSYIRDASAFMAKEILAVKPEGPYIFCGYCFQAGLTYEIARILAASGKKVDLLILVDLWATKGHFLAVLKKAVVILRLLARPFLFVEKSLSFMRRRDRVKRNDNSPQNPSSIIDGMISALSNYMNELPHYPGTAIIFLPDLGSKILNFLERRAWKRKIGGRLVVKHHKGIHEDWVNPERIKPELLYEFKRIFNDYLSEVQKGD